MKKTGQKKVSAKSLKVYKFAAAAADKKLAAAELAVASDPSAENKAAVQQARAKACAASAKLGRSAGAALLARGRPARRRRPILPLGSALASRRGLRESSCLVRSKLCTAAAAPHTQHR